MIEFGKTTLASVWDEDLTFLKKKIGGKYSVCVDMIPKFSNMKDSFCVCALREHTISFTVT